MKKTYLLLTSLLVSIASMAQWAKPSTPAAQPLSVGTECYLFNVEAEGFLVGANDWGTRASYDPYLGHKVIIENGKSEGSYYLTNYVLSGWMANQWGYMFLDNSLEAIYVDNTKDGKKDNMYTLTNTGSNVYQIGLSADNENYKDELMCYLGVIPERQDTRLYFCNPAALDYKYDGCMINWIFVSAADYATYTVARKQYDAAVKLGNSIDEAKNLNADAAAISAAENVYKNTSSTAEQLDAARTELAKAIKTAKYNAASVSNPVEVLAILGIATDFNNSATSGWTSTTGAVNKGAGNGNNAADYQATGNHYENWNGNAFTPGKISATATEIPTGVYHLNALAFSNTGADAYLYAGDSRTAVTATKIDLEQSFDCYTVVTDGKLEIGLDIATKGPNWVGLDNVYLYYLGNEMEAYTYLKNSLTTNLPDYEAMAENKEIAYQAAAYQAYSEALAALKAAATPEDCAAAIKAFNETHTALKESVAAYTKYLEKVVEAQDWLQASTGDNEYIDQLAAYLYDGATEGFNGNGSADYILENATLTNEQIAAETTYLANLLSEAEKNSMSDGDDCTAMLVNPNFTEQGGWTAAQGIEWPLGTADYKVFQAWGRVCDVYQNLTGLQNGLYEMNLQAVYKTDNDADIRQTYAYINDYDTKIGIPEEGVILNSAEEAATAFAAGTYPVKVYGLVTDGTMKIGIANRTRTGENGVLWAGGVKLIFRAKNAEALEQMLSVCIPLADEKLNSKCGQEEIGKLSDAISTAASATGANAQYDALLALKQAMDDVDAATEVYQRLNAAIEDLYGIINNNLPADADAAVVKEASDYLEETAESYKNGALSQTEAEEAIEQIGSYKVSIMMGGGNQGDQDVTSLIVNNNFDPNKGNKDEKRIDGWSVEGALNGYKKYTASFNKGTFKLSQALTGLPAGEYKVTVHTFYRAGSYEEEEANINAGKDTHLCKLFAETAANEKFEVAVVNLSEGAKGITVPEGVNTKTINGITVPDGTDASVACFNAGYYLNELKFTVGEDGNATIGLKLDETIGSNDYVVVGEWNLYKLASQTKQDVSSLIVNNNFDPNKGNKDEKRIDGWSVEGALNGYKKYTASFNKGTFDLNQKLTGLPKGKYEVTVHTFYRAGSYEEEEANINAGKDTHLCKLYAETSADEKFEVAVVNLSEGAKGITVPEGVNTKTINGITVPDGTDASVACFNAGYYLNTLAFEVGQDGEATIGLKLAETIGSNDYVVVGEWNLYYYGDNSESELKENDVTSLIVNNNFDPNKGNKDEKRIDGWNVTGALNGYKKYTSSFNKGTFDLNQKLTSLPEGTYKVTVHTFYRAGSYEEEEANINAGKDTHLCKLYANAEENYEKPVVNLSEGAVGITIPEGVNTKTINGITVPDGTDASVACFNAGYYLNELPFYVGKNGEVTIGLKLAETIGTNDYVVVGEWNLYYYGSGNNVDKLNGGEGDTTPVECIQLTPAEATPVAFYNMQGVRLSQPQRGINIIKMSDGRTVKVMMK